MWKSVFDSVRGTSHLTSDSPCQDACRVAVLGEVDEPLLLIACSDGAGSASHSHIGATTACDAIIELGRSFIARSKLEELAKEEVFVWYEAARRRIEEEAAALGLPIRELACTLLVAAIGPRQGVFAQLGDGAIVVNVREGYRAVFWPQSGEYANTTNFLTANAFSHSLEFAVLDEVVTDIAVFSDGLERLILRFTDRAVHSPFLTPLFKGLREAPDVEPLFAQLRAFLDSGAVNQRTDDDKTLVLASRINHTEP